MKEKKVLKVANKPRLFFNILFFTLLVFISVFFIYEYTIIGNPFSDPITPNILWACMFLVTILFAFRYIKTR